MKGPYEDYLKKYLIELGCSVKRDPSPKHPDFWVCCDTPKGKHVCCYVEVKFTRTCPSVMDFVRITLNKYKKQKAKLLSKSPSFLALIIAKEHGNAFHLIRFITDKNEKPIVTYNYGSYAYLKGIAKQIKTQLINYHDDRKNLYYPFFDAPGGGKC